MDPPSLQGSRARSRWSRPGSSTPLAPLGYDPLFFFHDPKKTFSVLTTISVAPLLSIGLFGFAWTSLGPPNVHWIAPMIFSCLIAIANVSITISSCKRRAMGSTKSPRLTAVCQFSIYMATIDYMIAAYGPYSASATGGNGFARDFLAGVAAMYSVPSKSLSPRFCTKRPLGEVSRVSCLALSSQIKPQVVDNAQCTRIWEPPCDWNGHRCSLRVWRSSLPSPSTCSIGSVPRFEKCRRLPRRWRRTERELDDAFRSVVRAIPILCNDTCLALLPRLRAAR